MVMPLRWSSSVGISSPGCETGPPTSVTAEDSGNEVDVLPLFQPVRALPDVLFGAVVARRPPELHLFPIDVSCRRTELQQSTRLLTVCFNMCISEREVSST